MAQFKPASYRRLDQTDHEMEPLATEGASQQTQQPVQQVTQPPPYIGYARPAQAFQQQSSSNNVVVATQPTAMPPVEVVNPHLKPKPTVMIVTIVLTVVCLVQQCWPVLVCMVPALIAAVVGFALSDSGSAEQRHTAKAFHAVAVCCNIATVVYYIMAAIVLIIIIATTFGLRNSYDDNYYGGGCSYSSCNYDDYSTGPAVCQSYCVN